MKSKVYLREGRENKDKKGNEADRYFFFIVVDSQGRKALGAATREELEDQVARGKKLIPRFFNKQDTV